VFKFIIVRITNYNKEFKHIIQTNSAFTRIKNALMHAIEQSAYPQLLLMDFTEVENIAVYVDGLHMVEV
jgi:hypothetical protein